MVLDRYDPHQTQFGPMYSNQSAVFSKLYRYASHEEPTWDNILPDLATGAPEMMEPTRRLTYIVKLRKGVKFHDTPKIRSNFPDLAGRELTAEDVIYSYDRQRNADSYQRTYYYRSSQYETIDKHGSRRRLHDQDHDEGADGALLPLHGRHQRHDHPQGDRRHRAGPGRQHAVGLGRLLPATARPSPADRMIGTGPFMWDTLTFGIEYKAVRNPEWFGWDDKSLGRPYLDGYKATGQGLNDATVESLFRRKEIDAAGFIDNPQWILNILDEIPELKFQRQQVSGWLNSRLKTVLPSRSMTRASAAPCTWPPTGRRSSTSSVPAPGSRLARSTAPSSTGRCPTKSCCRCPATALRRRPRRGHRRGPRAVRSGRQAGHPADLVRGRPGYIARYAPTYIETIKRNLGIDQDIKYQTVPYSRIAEGLVSQEADTGAFTWGFDNGWIDLDDWVYPYFKTGGPKNSFQVERPGPGQAAGRLSARSSTSTKRKQIGYDIQRYLLGVTNPEAPAANARIDYACPGGGGISWPYAKNGTSWPWFGNQYWAAEAWFDHSDPSFAGRKGQ